MKTRIALTVCLIVSVSLGLFVVWAASARAAEKPKAVQLFNGKNLDGFYTFIGGKNKGEDPDKVFSVTDEGLLRISGQSRGYLATKKKYANYRMVAEFKWGEGDRSNDSGIFFNADGNDKLWMKSLEVQMRMGATGDLCLIGKGSTLTANGKKHTRGCIARPGKGDPEKEIENERGKWNTIDLTCKGDTVRLLINGKLLLEGTAADPASGIIYFQCFKGELFYRKIEMYDLGDG